MVKQELRNSIACTARISILILGLSFSLFAQGKNPVILIPGLSGSELRHKDTGERIWFKTIRSRSEDLRLPISADLSAVHDNLIPTDAIRNVKIGPFPATDVYGGFIRAMALRGGYHEEKWDTPSDDGYQDSLYVYAYDWRLDNVENARRLIRQVEALKLKLKKPDLKFDIVAHSMGGIISRYAAMYGDSDLPAAGSTPAPTWAGAKYFQNIILMGTPSEGSAMSLGALLNGFTVGGIRIDLPFLQDSSKFTAFTIPSVYQLLPAPGTMRVFDDRLEPVWIDIYDPKAWSKYGWNAIDDREFVSEFSAAEQKIASAYFAASLDRAKRLHEALTAAPGKTVGVSFHVLGADCNTALDSILVYRDEKANRWKTLFRPKGFIRSDGLKITDDELRRVMETPGDGIVTRRSLAAATQSQKAGVQSIFSSETSKFICEEHNKMAANSRIQDYIIGVLNGKGAKEKEIYGKGR